MQFVKYNIIKVQYIIMHVVCTLYGYQDSAFNHMKIVYRTKSKLILRNFEVLRSLKKNLRRIFPELMLLENGSVKFFTKCQGICLMQWSMLKFTSKDSHSLAKAVTKCSGQEIVSGRIKNTVTVFQRTFKFKKFNE